MNEVPNRLKEFIAAIGENVARFETNLGFGNGFVRGTNARMRKATISKLQECYPQLNIDWLLTGEGQMLRPVNEQLSYSQPSDATMQELIKMFNRVMEVNEKNAEANRINAEANNRNALNIERLINLLEDKGRIAQVG